MLKNFKVRCAVFATIIITINTIMFFIFTENVEFYKQDINANLAQTSKIMSTLVDPNKLEYLVNSKEPDSGSYYNDVISDVKTAHKRASNIKYVYTVHQGKDGRILFGLDTSEKVDTTNAGVMDHAMLNSAYDEVPNTLREVFKTKKTTVSSQPYTDKWGTFLGAYTPLFNKNGDLVSVFCVEITYSYYLNKMKLLTAYITTVWIFLNVFMLMLILAYRKYEAQARELIQSKNKEISQNNDIRLIELGRIMASISHEINNPLQIIKLQANKLQRDGDRSEEAQRIIKNVDRIQNTITFVKTLIKNSDADTKEDVDLNEIAHVCSDFLNFKIKNSDITLDIDSQLAHIQCQKLGIQQVLLNLISNSMDELSKKGHGEVRVFTESHMHYTDLIVQDTGDGIPEEFANRISLGQFTSKSNGSGLGLVLVRNILQNNNADLMYKRKNNLTQFICRFYKGTIREEVCEVKYCN